MQEGQEAPLLRAAGGHLQWMVPALVQVLASVLVLVPDVLQLVPVQELVPALVLVLVPDVLQLVLVPLQVQERVLAERQRHSESGAAQPEHLLVAVQVLAQAQV